ncbi:Rab family gtpase [Histomonas meleagridis]|uniref:Rab family gtpase n=1 Tax=Histomonas meleagridis TaxID=135588 RepID=UPI003559F6E4|nr:Rab family gtpase [Histomonas meleagridis]KAH0802329.1 Rab family gtpase [Histomonas meleagridis]
MTKEITGKVLVIGNPDVGKTSLFKIIENSSVVDLYTTIQPTLLKYSRVISDTKVNVELWDTPGNTTYKTMLKNYLRNTIAFIFVFDKSCTQSFEELDDWYEFVSSATEIKLCYVVGNKTDLPSPQVSNEKAEEWAKAHKAKYIETSAVTRENVDFLFSTVTKDIFELSPKDDSTSDEKRNEVPIKLSKKKQQCC